MVLFWPSNCYFYLFSDTHANMVLDLNRKGIYKQLFWFFSRKTSYKQKKVLSCDYKMICFVMNYFSIKTFSLSLFCVTYYRIMCHLKLKRIVHLTYNLYFYYFFITWLFVFVLLDIYITNKGVFSVLLTILEVFIFFIIKNYTYWNL